MESYFQLILSPVLVILMKHAAGWTIKSQNLLMILSKTLKFDTNSFFLITSRQLQTVVQPEIIKRDWRQVPRWVILL